MHSSNPYNTGLDKNAANHTPLSPLSLFARTAYVYPARTAVIHGSVRLTWAEVYTRSRQLASALKKLGCRFALDDFGTGFSSFTHLRHLPVDFVKVEGSFVQGMPGSDLDRKMVSSITQLAQSLKLKVIGEHVDSFSTLQALRQAGP